MHTFCVGAWGAMVAGATLLILPPAAQAQKPKREPAPKLTRTAPAAGLFVRLMHLIPPAFVDDLKLDAKQAEEFRRLEKVFSEKRQAALVKTGVKLLSIWRSLEADDESSEPAPVLAIAHEVTGCLLEMRRARVTLERKAVAALNDEQRERYRQLKAGRVKPGAAVASADELLSPRTQRRLGLTPEQQKQIDDLRRDFDTRLRAILTEDQQRKLQR